MARGFACSRVRGGGLGEWGGGGLGVWLRSDISERNVAGWIPGKRMDGPERVALKKEVDS